MKPTTPKLTEGQIDFLNNFFYEKPPKFENLNFLHKALLQNNVTRKPYKELGLSRQLLALYITSHRNQNLYKKPPTNPAQAQAQAPQAQSPQAQAPQAPPAQAPQAQALPQPPQAPQAKAPGKFKMFTNLLKKTFKKKSVSLPPANPAQAPPAQAPQAQALPQPPQAPLPSKNGKFRKMFANLFKKKSVAPPPKLSVPLQTSNPMTHVKLPPHGVRAPRVSSKSSSSVSYHKSEKHNKKFTRRRGRVSSPHSSDSESSRRGLLISSSDASASIRPRRGRGSLRAISKLPSPEPISLPISASDLARRLVSKGAVPLTESQQAAKDSADLKRVMPVYYALRKGMKNIATKTRKNYDAWKLKRASAKNLPLVSKGAVPLTESQQAAKDSADLKRVMPVYYWLRKGTKNIGAKTRKNYDAWKLKRASAKNLPLVSKGALSKAPAPSLRPRAVVPAPIVSPKKGTFARVSEYIKTRRRLVARPVGEPLLESPSRSSSSASSTPSVRGRAVASASSGSPQKGMLGWLKKKFSREKTQNNSVKGTPLLRASSGSSSAAPPRKSPPPAAPPRKSPPPAAPPPRRSAAPGAITLPPVAPRPAPRASPRSAWSSDDTPSPKLKVNFQIKPKQSTTALPKGKGRDAPLPAWLGPVPPPPAVRKGIRGTPLPASPKKAMSHVIEDAEHWKASSFFDNVRGTPVIVSNLSWDAPKGSPAKKSASESSMSSSASSLYESGKNLSPTRKIQKQKNRKETYKKMIHDSKTFEDAIKAIKYAEKYNLKLDDNVGDHVSISDDESKKPKNGMDSSRLPPSSVVDLTSSSQGSSSGRRNPLSFGKAFENLEVNNRAVSPTFPRRDSIYGAWM